MGSPEVQIPITEMLVKELNVKGSFRYGVSGTQLNYKLFWNLILDVP